MKKIIEKTLDLIEIPALIILEYLFMAVGLMTFWMALYGLFCLIKLVF